MRPCSQDDARIARAFLLVVGRAPTRGRTRRGPPVPRETAGPVSGLRRPRGPPPRLRRLLPDAPGQQRIPLRRVSDHDDDPRRPFDPSPFAINAARSWANTPGRSGRWPSSCLLEEASARGGEAGRGRGEVGHLPVPARRAEPDGPLRPQAGAGEVSRQAVSGQAGDPLRQAGGQPARVAVPVPAARRSRAWCSASWCRTWRAWPTS